MTSASHPERGSAAFYILLGIALLASLSYVVSQGFRFGSGNISSDQAKMAAQEIIEYGNTVASAVQKLRLRGCADTQFSFANPVFRSHGGTVLYTDGLNPNAPGDGRCDIFKPSGGNVTASFIPLSHVYNWQGISSGNTALGSSRNGRMQIPGVGQEGREDLVLLIPYIRKEICTKINDLLGVRNPDNNPPTLTNLIGAYTTGVFTDNGSYFLSDPDGAVTGKTVFCISHPSGNPQDPFFVQVLIAR